MREIEVMTVDRLKLTLRNISSGSMRYQYPVKLSGLKHDLVSRSQLPSQDEEINTQSSILMMLVSTPSNDRY